MWLCIVAIALVAIAQGVRIRTQKRRIETMQRATEARARDDEQRAVARRAVELANACVSFNIAAAHTERGGRLMCIEDALSVIPELVWTRLIKAQDARLLEAHKAELVWVEGILATRADEDERASYLDGPAASVMRPVSYGEDMRNSLLPLRLFVDLLPEHHADPGFREKFVPIVAKEIENLDAIATSLLETPRVRSTARSEG